MALLPYALRPKVVIRRKAIWSGLLGPSTFWKVVGVFVFGQGTVKRFFGKNPEDLGTFKAGKNSFVNVINAAPMTAKERKKAGLTKQLLIDRAVADVAAARPGKGIRVKK